MRYMNDYDLTRAHRVAIRRETPNRLALVRTVANLADWTDEHSDGWAYWLPPRRAAQRAIAEIVGDGTNAADDRPDTTDAELKAALRPIKSFLTKHRVDHAVIIRTAGQGA